MRTVAALLLVVALLLPGIGHAQHEAQTPLGVAEWTADCVSGELADVSAGRAWLEQRPQGYRVVIPLRGQPLANRDVQSPPPATDTLAWIDLHRYERPAMPPISEADAAGVIVAESWPASYVGEPGGYPWLAVLSAGGYCLNGALGKQL